MKHKWYYQGKYLGDREIVGSHFVANFKFRDKSPNYFSHEIMFDYCFPMDRADAVFIMPRSITKTFSYVSGVDDYGVKYRYVKHKKDLIKEFRKVCQDGNLIIKI